MLIFVKYENFNYQMYLLPKLKFQINRLIEIKMKQFVNYTV